MFRLTITNLWANKIRFALTTFGVMLAVSFVVGAFVLGDGLRASFTDVSTEVTAGIDLEVRNTADFGGPPPLPAATVAVVAGVDGVADAAADIESADNAIRPIPPDGTTIPTGGGPPQLAFNWIDNPELSAFTLVDGSPPQVGEFTMDVDSATKYGFAIGGTYEFMIPDGRTVLTMSGTSSFGADNSTLGAVLMQMNTAQAGELFGIDGINSVVVELADGADAAEVQHAVRTAVDRAVRTAEVVDHATVLAETTSDFTREIDIVGNILLGFGGVALFVSIFIIYNTFSIVLGQRTRELALLRTVGAEPKQIRRSVLGEGLAVGVLASAGGIAGGIAVAKGIDDLFRAMGVDLVDYPLILADRTLVAAAVVGVGVTMLAALGPARRAATVPPIAALVGRTDADGAGSTRTVSGLVLIGVGLSAGIVGLAEAGSTPLTVAALAGGGIALFCGVSLISPLAVGVLTRLFGWPMRRVAGVAGGLAERNAARNSRRTATTAAALMIGLTLVSTALVVGESVKATFGSTIEHAARADYYLTDDLEDVTFPAALPEELRQSDVVGTAVGFTFFDARVDGAVTDVVGFDFGQIDAVLDLDITRGGFDRTVARPMVVSADEAHATGAGVGDTVSVDVANGSHLEATIVGLFVDHGLLGSDYLVDAQVLDEAGVAQTPEFIAVTLVADTSPAAVEAFVTTLARQHPQANVETADEYRQRVEGLIDGVLTMVNVMVALAVVIALIGIANTLALSVFERTRELGLMRAVGMTRRQVRRMVRLEAAVIALFGATLGVGLGMLFGFGVMTALPASFVSGMSVPVVPIAVVVLVAVLAGVAAAWLPARRASRLDVLDAIAL